MTTGFAGSTGPDNRTYQRDQQGRFSSTGGVRDVLAQAATVEAINAATVAEIQRVTGRTNVHVDFAGSDLQVAREHAEGVLQGFERFPDADVQQIVTYGRGGALPDSFADHQDSSTYAVQGIAPNKPGGVIFQWTIGFNAAYAGDAGRYRQSLDQAESDGWAVRGGPMSTALHEFGHVVTRQTAAQTAAARITADRARAAGEKPSAMVRREVSQYAATSPQELAAEAFADVMVHGSGASGTSQAIFDEITSRYDANWRGPQGHLPGQRDQSVPRILAAIDPRDIDLTAVQREFERRLDDLLRNWQSVSADQRDSIIDQVRSAVTSNDLNALARISVSTAAATEALTEAMVGMALEAAQQVVAEARAQDVRLDPVASDAAPFNAVAAALTELLAEGLTNAAGREALRRWSPGTGGDQVAAAVRSHLEGLSDTFVRDNLGSAMMSALTTGRMNTALSGPSAAIYASEQMDRNTCGPCREINGKWLGNSDDPDIESKVEAVYPNGGYRDCLGGVRCRGTTVMVWRPATVAQPNP